MVVIDRLTTNGHALFLAYDQGLEHGPVEFNDDTVDPSVILKIAKEGGFNAVILQKGIAEKYMTPDLEIPLILKLNGKTNLSHEEPFSPLICTVDEAVKLGASAVGYTVYVGSERQGEMLETFGTIIREAHAQDLPVIGWMYPRGRSVGEETTDVTAYAARVGLEVGADIVKVKYHPNVEALKHIVASAGKTKVVFSGGSHVPEEEFLTMVRNVKESGALGMAVGRNIWQSDDPLEMARKAKKILFDLS
ncbi:MAG: fructose-bisphosphate aldolase [bacterium]|nr:fructose-bisphosphate aldolase [bacterium]